jgi:small redox-active disulfide protein 2
LLVLGTGCAKCGQLYAAVEQAARELGVPYELGKVSDIRQILALRVMTTPALVVNGSVKVTGRVPGKEELLTVLRAASN